MPLSSTTLQEIAAVDAELEALTVKLERARQKKAAMEAQRERQQVLQQQVSQPTGPEAPASPLRQPQSQQLQKKLDSPLRSPVRRPTIGQQQQQQESQTHYEKEFPTATTAVSSPVRRVSPEGQPVKGASEMAKQKHQWDKPDWALPTDDIPDDCPIQTDSIVNPLLKQAQPGYERKVHAADLKLVAGKFVKPSPTAVTPDPRLVWIVANIDGMKVGKIVMHLYGNFLPIADTFLELKGLEVKRPKQSMLVVEDMNPVFYIHPGTPESFNGPRATACFGVVIEGQDIVQQLLQADPEALITIKQSHIYPVKKAKS
jgi:hypothetical protein